jgi:hypothetical protein
MLQRVLLPDLLVPTANWGTEAMIKTIAETKGNGKVAG